VQAGAGEGFVDGALVTAGNKVDSKLLERRTFLKLGMKNKDEGSVTILFEIIDSVLSMVRVLIWSGTEEMELELRMREYRKLLQDELKTSGKVVRPLLLRSSLNWGVVSHVTVVGATVGLVG